MVVGEFTQEVDLLVIGAGPAGYSAAFRAAELGVQTAIVDPRPSLGGVCLHEGCIPSKTLLGVASTLADAQRAAAFGISFSNPVIDLAALRARCADAIAMLARGLDASCKKHSVERLTGEAVFENSKHVAIRGGSVPRIKFRKAIIATGCSPIPHPQLPFDGSRIIAARDFLRMLCGAQYTSPMPERLAVIGHGYQAVEIASIASALGSSVTLRTPSEALLPDADADLARPLIRRLKETLADVQTSRDDINGMDENDMIVVALGERPATSSLALETTQVTMDSHGAITVDSAMRSSEPRIFAAGDVTGAPMLADKAILQGRIAGEVVAGWNSAFDARAVPTTIFTDPQLAWCGITEHEAQRANLDVHVVKIPWGASGRAVSLGRSDGMTKLIVDPATKLILGVGIVGAHASELIAEACLALEMGAVATDLAHTVHPHPSLSELLASAALQADDHAEAPHP